MQMKETIKTFDMMRIYPIYVRILFSLANSDIIQQKYSEKASQLDKGQTVDLMALFIELSEDERKSIFIEFFSLCTDAELMTLLSGCEDKNGIGITQMNINNQSIADVLEAVVSVLEYCFTVSRSDFFLNRLTYTI